MTTLWAAKNASAGRSLPTSRLVHGIRQWSWNLFLIKTFIISSIFYISYMQPLVVVVKILGSPGKNDSLLFHSKMFYVWLWALQCFTCDYDHLCAQGRSQTFSFGGGPLEGPVLQQGELSMVRVGLSERDLKNCGGATGGPGKILGRQWPPWPPLAPPLIVPLRLPTRE